VYVTEQNKDNMDFRCKFVMLGCNAEAELFSILKQAVENELAWDLPSVDFTEVEARDCLEEPAGMVRVPVNFRFRTTEVNEASTLFDIFTWVAGMIGRFGQNFGVDEITVDGWQVEIVDNYRAPQLESVQPALQVI